MVLGLGTVMTHVFFFSPSLPALALALVPGLDSFYDLLFVVREPEWSVVQNFSGFLSLMRS